MDITKPIASDGALVAGVELGGTKCIAVLARDGTILERETIDTRDPEATLRALSERIAGWRAAQPDLASLGIASFGPLSLNPAHSDYGRITTTPKPGWAGTDVRGALAAGFPGSVGFDTDVNAAALAEGRWGAARGADVHVYLTIGTGVGGGVIVHGRAVHGLMHPEIGHVRVPRRRRVDRLGEIFAGICPYHGDCVEGLTTGPAIAARTGRDATGLPDDHPVWGEVADTLGELVANLLLTVSAERVLVGGGIGVGRPTLLPLIRQVAAERLGGYLGPATSEALASIIRAPALGEDAGPLGAAALAMDALAAR